MPYIEFSNPVSVKTSPVLPNVPVSPIDPQIKWFTMKSLFSNNAQVIHKSRTNFGGGVGTVSNSGRKAKYT
jgi:hypothetical protein